MKENFVKYDRLHEKSIPNDVSDIMKMKENFMAAHVGREKSITNDVSNTYKFNSQGETLWSLQIDMVMKMKNVKN